MSKGDGLNIGLKFTEDLIGDVSGLENGFSITGKQFQYVNGPLIDQQYQIDKVERYPVDKIWADSLDTGVHNGTRITSDGVSLALSDTGLLYTDDLTGGLSYFSTSVFSSSYANHRAFDDKLNTTWSAQGANGQAVGVDFGVDRRIEKLRIKATGRLQNFVLEGSNNKSTWVAVFSGTQLGNSEWQEYTFTNQNAYRYYRVKCSGTLYNGSNVMITEIEMMESKKPYVTTGSYLASTAINGRYSLFWEEEIPDNTSLILDYEVGDGQWKYAQRQSVIQSYTILSIRATLSTSDISVTPKLKSLWLQELSAPQNKILITTQQLSRFNNVEGELTIDYDSTKGVLAGVGGTVENFTKSFLPQDLIKSPDPHAPERFTVAPNANILFTRVIYNNRYASDKFSVTATCTINFEFVGIINP